MGPGWSMLDEIAEKIRLCARCPLHRGRKNAVPGEGPASWLAVVGEAPGSREDELGRPFVGPAGRLLRSELRSLGLEAFITNAVRCRPPGNRRPTAGELYACLPHLVAELSVVKPRVIVALGETAGRALSSIGGLRWRGLSAVRGRSLELRMPWGRVTVLFTYHPAAAMRNSKMRAAFEEDLKKVISLASPHASHVEQGGYHEAKEEGRDNDESREGPAGSR